MKIYRKSRYRGCGLCKPHKAGAARRWKAAEEQARAIAAGEVREAARKPAPSS